MVQILRSTSAFEFKVTWALAHLNAHPNGVRVAPQQISKSFVLLSSYTIFILLNCGSISIQRCAPVAQLDRAPAF
jgi:hypothetical protein